MRVLCLSVCRSACQRVTEFCGPHKVRVHRVDQTLDSIVVEAEAGRGKRLARAPPTAVNLSILVNSGVRLEPCSLSLVLSRLPPALLG